MEMMTIKKLFILLLVSSISGVVLSQDDDFGIWTGLESRHSITSRLDLELSGSFRTFTNSTTIDEIFAEGGLQYRFSRYFAVYGSYRLTDKYEDDSQYYLRHKLFLALKSSVPTGNITFSGRLMLQRTSNTYIEDDTDLTPYYTGRLKLKSYYNVPSFPLNPYIYAETFAPVSSGSGLTIGRNRFSGGMEFKINKKNSLELEYIFQRDYQPHLTDEHIISLNYKVKF
jgi:hypothetical protein